MGQKNCSSYPKLSTWLFTALLVCALVQITHADCPVTFYPRKTITGSLIATFDQTNQKQEQTYQYPLYTTPKITIRPSVAVGVVNLGLQRKSQQFGYNIQTSFYAVDPVALIFKVKAGTLASQDVWRYIQFKFIFSDDPEILAGTQDVLEFSRTSDPNVFRSSQYIPPSTMNFNYKAKVKIFISGVEIVKKQSISSDSLLKIDQTIRKIQNLNLYSWNQQLIRRFTKILVNQKSPSLKITQPEYAENSLIKFQIRTAQLQIRAISYSYLVYLERPYEYRIYRTTDGSFSTADQQSYAYTKLAHDEMTFVGISGFSYSSDQSGNMGLRISQVEQNSKSLFVSEVEGQFVSFTVEFFGIETLPGLICKTCPGSPLLFAQFCVSQCPFGLAISINSDGQFICQACEIENFLIPSEDGMKCVCSNGHYLISPIQVCSICPYDCLTCNGDICLSCDPTSFRVLNQGNNRCQCPPFNNRGVALYDDVNTQAKKCVQCNPRCKTCIGSKVNQCTSCESSRIFIDGVCRCGPNLVQSSLGECVCQPPYTLNKNGVCQLTSTKCNQNQVLITLSNRQKTCNCTAGYTRSISNKCIKQCQSYEQLNYQTQKCECKPGFTRNTLNSICYSCQQVLNQVYNNQTKKCECMDGFQLNKAGFCISCPPKSYYSPSSDKCLCIFNFYQQKPNGPCLKCTPQVTNSNCRTTVFRTSLIFDDNSMSIGGK